MNLDVKPDCKHVYFTELARLAFIATAVSGFPGCSNILPHPEALLKLVSDSKLAAGRPGHTPSRTQPPLQLI